MKRKSFLLALFGIGVFLIFAQTSYSLPIAGQDAVLTRTGTYGGAYGGGEFLANLYDNGSSTSGDSFISFCLEYSEHISLGYRYNIAGVDDYAARGGGAAGGASNANSEGEYRDYVDDATKWLMYNYLYGNEFFSRTNLATDANASSVQKLIWFIEEEDWTGGGLTNSFNTLAQEYQNLYNNTLASITSFEYADNVKVLNLEYNGEYRQSQLIAAPVPEPATMLLFGTGLVGLAGFMRVRRRK